MPFSRASLYENDRTWLWKAILRAFAILLDIIGLGLTGWALANANRNNQIDDNYEDDSYFYWDDYDSALIPWNLISFSLSFIWCLTNLCILLSRSRWIHPGANVGSDLILWLAFIVTALFSTAGTVQDLLWYSGSYGYDNYSYTSGDSTYAYYPNGTSYEVTPSHPAPPCPGFDSCAVKNEIMGAQHKRGVVVATASAFAWLLVLVHFALFVSACRYTHERRRGRFTDERMKSEAEKIEERVIRRLEAEGRLRTPPSTAHGAGPEGMVPQSPGYESALQSVPQIRVDSTGEAGADRHPAKIAEPVPTYSGDVGQDREGADRINYV